MSGCPSRCCGLALTCGDVLRHSVVMALMCWGRLDFEFIDLAHLDANQPQFSGVF